MSDNPGIAWWRRMVMNVTPAEFKDIYFACQDLPEADIAEYMSRYYGCERFTSYRVVVHRDAPAIPMLSWGLNRFEPDLG